MSALLNEKLAKVQIVGAVDCGKIRIDGVDISRYVTSIQYRHDSGCIPVLTVDLLLIDGIEIEAEAQAILERYD